MSVLYVIANLRMYDGNLTLSTNDDTALGIMLEIRLEYFYISDRNRTLVFGTSSSLRFLTFFYVLHPITSL